MDDKIKNLYQSLFEKFGVSPEAVKARDAKQQYLRFKHLIDLAEINQEDSVLDIGCGSGELLTYLRKNNTELIIICVSKVNQNKGLGSFLFENAITNYDIHFQQFEIDFLVCNTNYRQEISLEEKMKKSKFLKSSFLQKVTNYHF